MQVRAIRFRPRVTAFAVAALAAMAGGCDPGATTKDAGPRPAADAKATPDMGNPSDSGGTKDVAPVADAAPSTDGGPTDAAAPLGDAGVLAPPGVAPPPLFDPDAPGASPLDAPIAAVIGAWHDLPTDEATAQAHLQRLLEALDAVRTGGSDAADRIADVCAEVPVAAVGPGLDCLRLLSMVDSPRSLDLLAQRAQLEPQPYPEGAHPHDPPPEDLLRRVALRSLGQRARAGTAEAAEQLLRIAGSPNSRDRGPAVHAVLLALPRAEAKRRLRAVLPPEELYRLYQTR